MLLKTPSVLLSGWSYGVIIAYRNVSGIDLTGRPLSIDFNSRNFPFSQAKSDGSDLRFTDETGGALDFFQQWHSLTSKTARYDVELPTCPAGSTIYIYAFWGNSSATSLSSFANTHSKRVVDADTIALWHLDDGSGSAPVNAVGGGAALTLHGAVSWVADERFPTGHAVKVNGTGQYISAPGSLVTPFPRQGAIAFSWKPTNLRGIGAGNERLLSKFAVSGGSPLNGIELYPNTTDGKLQLNVHSAGTTRTIKSIATSWAAGVDHRICITWDMVTLRFYIDAALQGWMPRYLPNMSGSEDILIGYENEATFDEIFILSRVLHPDEVFADADCRKLIPRLQQDKWVRQASITSVAGGECAVIGEADGTFSYYGGVDVAINPNGYVLGHYVAATPDGPWTPSPNPDNWIIGRGRGGAGSSEGAHRMTAFQTPGYTWILAATGIPPSVDPGCNINVYRKPDGGSWSKMSQAVSATALPFMNSCGNVGVWPEKVNGVYHGLVEAFFTDTQYWEIFHMTSDDLINWNIDTASGRLRSLQVFPDSCYSGPHRPLYIDGVWHLWYHYAISGAANSFNTTLGVLPTNIAHATSLDMVNWTIDRETDAFTASSLGIDKPYSPYEDDQVADPWIIESNGHTYLFHSAVVNNQAGAASTGLVGWPGQFLQKFNGTIADLIDPGIPDIQSYSFPTPEFGGPQYLKYLPLLQDWDSVTTEEILDDGGADYNRESDDPPERWRFEYDGLSQDEAAILDAHHQAAKGKTETFTFVEPRDEPAQPSRILTGVRYELYEVDHLKTWSRSRRATLIRRP